MIEIIFLPLALNSPVGETWRYKVWLLMPSSLERSATTVPLLPIAACTRRNFAGVGEEFSGPAFDRESVAAPQDAL
jgi:hypothetical protein